LGSTHSWPKFVKDWWRTVWTSPWAGLYEAQDHLGLLQLAALTLKWFQEQTGEERADGKPITMSPSERTTMMALQDRYGLTPRSRQVLRWETPEEQTGAKARPGSAPAATPVDTDRRERLKAV
jgi:hypothetical protein